MCSSIRNLKDINNFLNGVLFSVFVAVFNLLTLLCSVVLANVSVIYQVILTKQGLPKSSKGLIFSRWNCGRSRVLVVSVCP